MWLRVADYTDFFTFRNQFEFFLNKKEGRYCNNIGLSQVFYD
ncbi:Hypothetical protein GGC_0342 [Haemophilus haemolyticus M21621]|nr:Hypothetical protein GGC_0342 [Haemophilus haemolyticus M21621]